MKTLVAAIVIAAFTGEVMCIVKFCKSDFKPTYKRECIYGIAAVTGLGAIVGWMDIKDKAE